MSGEENIETTKQDTYISLTLQNTKLLQELSELSQKQWSQLNNIKLHKDEVSKRHHDEKQKKIQLKQDCKDLEDLIRKQHEMIMKLRKDILSLKRKGGNR